MEVCNYNWAEYTYILDVLTPFQNHWCELPKGHEFGDINIEHRCLCGESPPLPDEE